MCAKIMLLASGFPVRYDKKFLLKASELHMKSGLEDK